MLAQESGARLELVHVLEKTSLKVLCRWFGDEGETLQQRIRSQARNATGSIYSVIFLGEGG